MALRIRLALAGAKKRPFYKIIVANSRSPRDGSFIERIGSYNPFLSNDNNDRIKINEERAKYWLSVGALPSERVAIFLGKAGCISMPKYKETPKKSAPKKKAQERIAAAAAEVSAG